MKTRNSNLVNDKAPAEHVTPASKERVQQVGRHPEGIWIRLEYPVQTPTSKLFLVAGYLVRAAPMSRIAICGGMS